MENFYAFLLSNPHFSKITYCHLTLIEYNCPLQQEYVPVWTPHDYVVHIISGKKTWYTLEENITLQQGDTAYIRKGGHIVRQYFEENFCLLLFFVTDEVKKELLLGEAPRIRQPAVTDDFTILYRIKGNAMLHGFFFSVLSFFKMNQPPVDEIIRLKMQEFAHILHTESENIPVLCHLFSIEHHSLARLKTIMSQNYTYQLSPRDFAELCNRSVSSFRRDFIKCYHTTLSKWLHSTRLVHASSLLVHTNLSVSQIALESGFENLSHFSKSFRHHFQCTPSQYRRQQKLNALEQSLEV